MKGRPNPENLTLGICLAALGVVWTLSNLGRLEALPLLRRFWPLALVLWGVLELVMARGRRATPPAGDGAASEEHR